MPSRRLSEPGLWERVMRTSSRSCAGFSSLRGGRGNVPKVEFEGADKLEADAADLSAMIVLQDRMDYNLGISEKRDAMLSGMRTLIDRDFKAQRELRRLAAVGNLAAGRISAAGDLPTEEAPASAKQLFDKTGAEFSALIGEIETEMPDVAAAARALLALGTGDEGVFAPRAADLASTRRQESLLADNARAAAAPSSEASTLVTSSRDEKPQPRDDGRSGVAGVGTDGLADRRSRYRA